eukprot:5388390-Heterocapsa_arctica.AAC.1
MRAEAQAEIQTMLKRAAIEARVIVARATEEANVIATQLKTEQRKKDEAAAAEEEEKKQATLKTERLAQAEAKKEAAAALRRAKEVEQQRAKQHSKEAEQERRLEQQRRREAEEARAKADEELEKERKSCASQLEVLRAELDEAKRAGAAGADGSPLQELVQSINDDDWTHNFEEGVSTIIYPMQADSSDWKEKAVRLHPAGAPPPLPREGDHRRRGRAAGGGDPPRPVAEQQVEIMPRFPRRHPLMLRLRAALIEAGIYSPSAAHLDQRGTHCADVGFRTASTTRA